ncbi:MAG TPA: SRPBCC family protein [Thermoanaerobaculia bacterium]|nr:SRPBCC family protein [Thermoanaerobaculia bacterium]
METTYDDDNSSRSSAAGIFESIAAPGRINISRAERFGSAIAGGALAVYGISRRSPGGIALGVLGAALLRRGLTGHCEVYQMSGMNTADHENASVGYGKGIRVEKTITIGKPAAELFRYWRQLSNLPRFMEHLESVTVLDSKRSHWVAKGPVGTSVEWDAEINNEVPDQMIAWKSIEGAEVDNAGSVHFTAAPGGRGTEVKVLLRYDPPGGKLGAAFARLFGEEPSQQIREDLRRFKRLMETGEIPTTEGQTSGRES